MHKIFTFLSCLISIPAVAFDDACTKPDKFTVDRRCYVTDEQKTQKPFNAVASLLNQDGYTHCTGTVININGQLHLVTARHCVVDKDVAFNSQLIRLQDHRELEVAKDRIGSWNGGQEDYAYYVINAAPNDIPYVTISTLPNNQIAEKDLKKGSQGKYSWANATLVSEKDLRSKKTGIIVYDAVRLVGYGAFKIMSDQDIKDFREQYITYLKKSDHIKDPWTDTGIVSYDDEGIRIFNLVYKFIDDYYADKSLFKDNENLKVSTCQYKNGQTMNCQGWGGNSGGGVFDTSGNIMGIVSMGVYIISTDALRHAKVSNTINLLYESGQKNRR